MCVYRARLGETHTPAPHKNLRCQRSKVLLACRAHTENPLVSQEKPSTTTTTTFSTARASVFSSRSPAVHFCVRRRRRRRRTVDGVRRCIEKSNNICKYMCSCAARATSKNASSVHTYRRTERRANRRRQNGGARLLPGLMSGHALRTL